MQKAGQLPGAWGFNTCQVGERVFQFRPLSKGPALIEVLLGGRCETAPAYLSLDKLPKFQSEGGVGNYSCCSFNSQVLVLVTDWARGGVLVAAALVDPGEGQVSGRPRCLSLKISPPTSFSGNIFLTQYSKTSVFACCSQSPSLYSFSLDLDGKRLFVTRLKTQGLPLRLTSATVALPDGRMLAAGGWIAGEATIQGGVSLGLPYSRVAILSISGSTVDISELMPFSAPPRQGAAATLLAGRFLAVFGGWGERALDDLFLVDLQTRRCSAVQKSGAWHPSEYQGSLFAAKNTLYFFGDAAEGNVYSLSLRRLRELARSPDVQSLLPERIVGGPAYPPPQDEAYLRWLSLTSSRFPSALAFSSTPQDFKELVQELREGVLGPAGSTNPMGGERGQRGRKGSLDPAPLDFPSSRAAEEERREQERRIAELEGALAASRQENAELQKSLAAAKKGERGADAKESKDEKKQRKLMERAAELAKTYSHCIAVNIHSSSVRAFSKKPETEINLPLTSPDAKVVLLNKKPKIPIIACRPPDPRWLQPSRELASLTASAEFTSRRNLERLVATSFSWAGPVALFDLTMTQLASGGVLEALTDLYLILAGKYYHRPILKAQAFMPSPPERSSRRKSMIRHWGRLQLDPLRLDRMAAAETKLISFMWVSDQFAYEDPLDILMGSKYLKFIRKHMEATSLFPTKEERRERKAIEALQAELAADSPSGKRGKDEDADLEPRPKMNELTISSGLLHNPGRFGS